MIFNPMGFWPGYGPGHEVAQAIHILLIFSSLDGTSNVHLKLLHLGYYLVMLYRSAQATDILLPRWH